MLLEIIHVDQGLYATNELLEFLLIEHPQPWMTSSASWLMKWESNRHFESMMSDRPLKKARDCAAICLSSLYLQTS